MMTLEEILDEVMAPEWEASKAVLLERLRAREDAICDVLRLAGAQFGMMPGLVSGVILQVGLGTEPPEDERALIVEQFNASVAELRRMIEQHYRDNNGS